MSRILAALLVVLSAAVPSLAAEADEEARRASRRDWWKAPIFLVVGLPRDLIDAPSKLISSVPVVRNVTILPMLFINTVTTAAAWSYTDDGMDAGFEAWMDCLKLERKKRARGHVPESLQDRRWYQNYFPNTRTFLRIVGGRPKPKAD